MQRDNSAVRMRRYDDDNTRVYKSLRLSMPGGQKDLSFR
jgi:hypothetical protein